MDYRDFGETGLKVSEIGMGCGWPNYAPDVDMAAYLRRAFDLGVNFYDTADMYWSGESERLLGEAFASKRDEVIIATKFGTVIDDQGWHKDFGVEYMHRALEGSLRRLQTDYVDVYLLHSPLPPILDDEELLAALCKLKEEGKVRFFGISLDGVDFCTEAIERWQPDVIQITFNLFNLDVTRAFPMITEEGVGLIAKSPLDSGMLSGELSADAPFKEGYDPRQRWGEESTKKRQEYMEQLRSILEKPDRNWPQAALQFVLSFDAVSTAIVGTTNIKHLEENIEGAERRLSQGELEKIRSLLGGEFAKLNLGW